MAIVCDRPVMPWTPRYELKFAITPWETSTSATTIDSGMST